MQTKTQKQLQKECKEVIELVIKRSGVSKKNIYNDALKRFFRGNMDLLTPAELKKYKDVILQ